MGMPVSVLLRGPDVDGGRVGRAVGEVFAELHRLEAVFSMFRADSDVRRWIRGEVGLRECDPTVAEVVDLCIEAEHRTDGAFSAWLPPTPAPTPTPGFVPRAHTDLYALAGQSEIGGGGVGAAGFDPTGLVKGWAVERAAQRLVALGDHDVCLNAGGDVVLWTVADDAPAWRVGIENPADTRQVLAVVEIRRGALATSGSAHRGQHIVDPASGTAAGELWSASVCGPSLLWADVYATAAVVKGSAALAWLETTDDYDVLVVDRDGGVVMTKGFPVAGGSGPAA